MSRPDLNTEEGRAEYRRELRRIGWPARVIGFVLILIGAGVVTAMRLGWIPFNQPAITASYGALALGWVLFIAVIFIRTRHHKRRLAEGL